MSHSQTAHPPSSRVGVVEPAVSARRWPPHWRRSGHRIVAVSAVSADSLGPGGRCLPGTPVRPPQDVAASADLVLLTVPDDALPGAGVRAGGHRHRLAGPAWSSHAGGRHGLAVLEPATRPGCPAARAAPGR